MTSRGMIRMGMVSSVVVVAGTALAMGPRTVAPSTGGVAQDSQRVKAPAPVWHPSGEAALGLLMMREEEKVARDVYFTLGQMWNANVFNITFSEQRHMDIMASMLDRFGLVDPVIDDTVGAFATPAFAELYELLVLRGSVSIMEAYKVGAKIEELDLVDLRHAVGATTDPVLIDAYGELMRGTRNHLRAFARQITNNGGTYVAEHLTQGEFDEIANSDMEPGGG